MLGPLNVLRPKQKKRAPIHFHPFHKNAPQVCGLVRTTQKATLPSFCPQTLCALRFLVTLNIERGIAIPLGLFFVRRWTAVLSASDAVTLGARFYALLSRRIAGAGLSADNRVQGGARLSTNDRAHGTQTCV